MTPSVLLISLFTAIFAALIAAMVVVRRRQTALLRQREALQKQRGAAHIRATALAAYAHTGRADIAIVLLQLSCEMLEEAVQMAPDEAAVVESLKKLHELMDSLQVDDRPATPVPNPESQSELTQASMQLTEATRLLVRLEVRAELESAELRSMQSELRRVQRSLDFRTRMRRELEAPSVLMAPPELDPALPATDMTARISPSH
ncbi:MAG: hypothetical protein ABW049_05810 [Spongiibacteraceae bacterium]